MLLLDIPWLSNSCHPTYHRTFNPNVTIITPLSNNSNSSFSHSNITLPIRQLALSSAALIIRHRLLLRHRLINSTSLFLLIIIITIIIIIT